VCSSDLFLRENLRLNGLLPMKYRHGHWGPGSVAPRRIEAGTAGILAGRFDLVIGSDLLYERDAEGALAAYVGRHSAPAAEVWIIDPDRGNRPAFHRAMEAQGFAMHEERIGRLASPGIAAYRGRMLTYRRRDPADP
jgi:predicted nicotinamide N-methyase